MCDCPLSEGGHAFEAIDHCSTSPRQTSGRVLRRRSYAICHLRSSPTSLQTDEGSLILSSPVFVPTCLSSRSHLRRSGSIFSPRPSLNAPYIVAECSVSSRRRHRCPRVQKHRSKSAQVASIDAVRRRNRTPRPICCPRSSPYHLSNFKQTHERRVISSTDTVHTAHTDTKATALSTRAQTSKSAQRVSIAAPRHCSSSTNAR